jgi:hypothetical protein
MPALYPVHAGMIVRLADGGSATVVDVLTGLPEQPEPLLVINAHGFFGRDVIVPYAAVWRVDTLVHLNLSTQEVLALPVYDAGVHKHSRHAPCKA